MRYGRDESIEGYFGPPVHSDMAIGRVRLASYLSGPMTGYPDLNFPAFNAAAAALRRKGMLIVNPAELGEHADWSRQDYYRRDVVAMLQCCSCIVMLPGWRYSDGAKGELATAQFCGLRVGHYNPSLEIVEWDLGGNDGTSE